MLAFATGMGAKRKLAPRAVKRHRARRALDEPAAEPLFEPLQLQADRGLRRPHRFSRAA